MIVCQNGENTERAELPQQRVRCRLVADRHDVSCITRDTVWDHGCMHLAFPPPALHRERACCSKHRYIQASP